MKFARFFIDCGNIHLPFEITRKVRNCVCKKCNHEIGKAEEQVGRSGPEAFFRQYLGIEGRHKKKKNPFRKGSFGAQPIEFIAALPEREVDVLWEFNPNQRTIHELTQIVLVSKQGESKPLRIHDDWLQNPKRFHEHIKELNFAERFDVILLAGNEDECQQLERLIRQLRGDMPNNFDWETPRPSTVYSGTIHFSVTDAYFRAVAKCAFHYLLAASSNLRGDEMSFKDIRAFIMNGGQYEKFITQERRPILQYQKNYRPESYLHVLAANWDSGNVEVRVQFFVGPDYEPLTYRVYLGQNVIALVHRGSVGHSFIYFPEGKRGKYHGKTIPLSATPMFYLA